MKQVKHGAMYPQIQEREPYSSISSVCFCIPVVILIKLSMKKAAGFVNNYLQKK